MSTPSHDEDVRAVETLIERQFASLNWTKVKPADRGAFAADFFENGPLYAAARPAQGQSVGEFVERIKGVSKTRVNSLH